MKCTCSNLGATFPNYRSAKHTHTYTENTHTHLVAALEAQHKQISLDKRRAACVELWQPVAACRQLHLQQLLLPLPLSVPRLPVCADPLLSHCSFSSGDRFVVVVVVARLLCALIPKVDMAECINCFMATFAGRALYGHYSSAQDAGHTLALGQPLLVTLLPTPLPCTGLWSTQCQCYKRGRSSSLDVAHHKNVAKTNATLTHHAPHTPHTHHTHTAHTVLHYSVAHLRHFMDLSSLWIAFSIFISVFSGSNFYKFIMWEIKRQLWFNHNSTYSTFPICDMYLFVCVGGTYFYDTDCCVLVFDSTWPRWWNEFDLKMLYNLWLTIFRADGPNATPPPTPPLYPPLSRLVV